jgi:hypothetical protein
MQWCPTCGQVQEGDVEAFGTTSVHKIPPWHRLVDGAVIQMKDGAPELDDSGEPIVDFEGPDVAEEEE